MADKSFKAEIFAHLTTCTRDDPAFSIFESIVFEFLTLCFRVFSTLFSSVQHFVFEFWVFRFRVSLFCFRVLGVLFSSSFSSDQCEWSRILHLDR